MLMQLVQLLVVVVVVGELLVSSVPLQAIAAIESFKLPELSRIQRRVDARSSKLHHEQDGDQVQ